VFLVGLVVYIASFFVGSRDAEAVTSSVAE